MTVARVEFLLRLAEDFTPSLGVAEVWVPEVSVAGESRTAYWPNTRYMCPWCGSPWASEVWDHPDAIVPATGRESMPPWTFVVRACRAHGDGRIADNIPGQSMPPTLAAYLAQTLFNLLDQGRINVNTST